MASLFWLDDDQWRAIAPLIPGRVGPPRQDDRRMLSAILHVLKGETRWSDCPPEYGPYMTVVNRFQRWSQKPFWPALVQRFVEVGALEPSDDPFSAYGKILRKNPRRRRPKTDVTREALLSGVEVATVKGQLVTGFFIFMGEAVSVQVTLPSPPGEGSAAKDQMAHLNAARVLMTAAVALIEKDHKAPKEKLEAGVLRKRDPAAAADPGA